MTKRKYHDIIYGVLINMDKEYNSFDEILDDLYEREQIITDCLQLYEDEDIKTEEIECQS